MSDTPQKTLTITDIRDYGFWVEDSTGIEYTLHAPAGYTIGWWWYNHATQQESKWHSVKTMEEAIKALILDTVVWD